MSNSQQPPRPAFTLYREFCRVQARPDAMPFVMLVLHLSAKSCSVLQPQFLFCLSDLCKGSARLDHAQRWKGCARGHRACCGSGCGHISRGYRSSSGPCSSAGMYSSLVASFVFPFVCTVIAGYVYISGHVLNVLIVGPYRSWLCIDARSVCRPLSQGETPMTSRKYRYGVVMRLT